MKLVLKIAKSAKGNDYMALGVYDSRGKFVALTFDPITISRATGLSMREIYMKDLGDYPLE